MSLPEPSIPYKSWNLYFENVTYAENLQEVTKIKAVEKYLHFNNNLVSSEEVYFTVDVDIMCKSPTFIKDWPNFAIDLQDKPESTMNCLKLAMHEARDKALKEKYKYTESAAYVSIPLVKLKLFNYNWPLKVNEIRVSNHGKLVSVKGSVVKVNKVKELITDLTMYCTQCFKIVNLKLENGVYKNIKGKCFYCGNGNFEADFSLPGVRSTPFQVIKIQEPYGDEANHLQSAQNDIDVEVFEDLTDSCIPGEDVLVIGIVEMTGSVNVGNLPRNSSVNNRLYLKAINIISNSLKDNNTQNSVDEFDNKDLILVKNIHGHSDLLCLLVHSLCPGIHGYEMEKLALLLALFSGSSSGSEVKSENIHVILLGDPGLGKSQLLKSCAKVAPKGFYISGTSTSKIGLTGALVKNDKQYTIEPGVLVLADGGCCCMDEFDKMLDTDQSSLLEVMESKTFTVTKATVHATLPARTTVVAAGNPKKGRYDKSKTIIENTKISRQLLNRFGLVFILIDEPDKDFDNYLSLHVMDVHSDAEKSSEAKNVYIEKRIEKNVGEMNPLLQRLIQTSKMNGLLKPQQLRMYIRYVRQYVKTKLTKESAEKLQKYFLHVRSSEFAVSDIDFNARQLHTLINLTTTIGQLHLREQTTEKDAEWAISLMKQTAVEKQRVHSRSQQTNFSTASAVVGRKKNNPISTFMQLVKSQYHDSKKTVFTVSELKQIATKLRINEGDCYQIIEKLNYQGIFLKQSPDCYKYIP